MQPSKVADVKGAVSAVHRVETVAGDIIDAESRDVRPATGKESNVRPATGKESEEGKFRELRTDCLALARVDVSLISPHTVLHLLTPSCTSFIS